jgi:anti-anti-sigma factor
VDSVNAAAGTGRDVTVEINPAGPGMLIVRGALDLAGVPQLQAAVGDLIAAGGPGGDVSLDMTGVTAFDSAGIGALVQANHLFEQHGTRLVLVNLPTSVQRWLTITALDQVFTIR